MKCLLEDVPGTRDARGWRMVRCLREKCDVAKPAGVGPTPHPFENIDSDCTGNPFWWEVGHWLGLTLAAVGITKDRYGLLLRKPGCQSCNEREAALNTIGSRFANGLKALWNWLKTVWGRIAPPRTPRSQ